MNTLLIVEDDPTLGASLTQGFREQDFAVELAGSLAAARARLTQGGIHLVVLDLGLPDGDGFVLLRDLAKLTERPPVLITTARGELDERLRGLEGGAEDYLVKPCAFAELLARVRVLLRRTQPGAGGTLRVGDLELDTLAHRATRGGAPLDLTPREFDLLAHLALARGEVVTREMLARSVWQQRSWTASMDNVIDVHISRLREKVDQPTSARLLHTVRGVGFRLKAGT
jgi:two-component system copper resistance phosphate regulon response regulator CusR